MAKYVVIEFDDNTQAEALCAQINTATEKGKPFRVVGLFARPNRNCRCATSRADYVERTKTAKPLRGNTFGWFICPDCKRARFGDQSLNNLLGVDDVISPRVFNEISWLGMPPQFKDWEFQVKSLMITVLPHQRG